MFASMLGLVMLISQADAKAPVPLAPLSPEGRLIYANDDDWDWATPERANKPSGLATYGRMAWSALDWMEDGLDKVDAMLVGTPPELGNYLTMADLNKLRGNGGKRGYERIDHKENTLAKLLRDQKPHHVVILKQDCGPPNVPISQDDITAAVEYVRRGGRLIILDDWKCYRRLVEPFGDAKNFAAPKPAKPPPVDPGLHKRVLDQVTLLDDKVFRV